MIAWFEYGTFCRRNGMNATAQECFKEILAVDSKHLHTLIAYGAICSENEQFEKARVFLHSAVDCFPNSTLALLVLALFYDILGEEEENEKYLTLAQSANALDDSGCEDSMYLSAAKFLVATHAGQLTERALSEV